MSQVAIRNLLVFLGSRTWRDVLDIAVVTFLFYRLLLLIRGTRAVQLTFGLSLLVLVGLAAKVLNLQLTYFIFSNLAPALLIGVTFSSNRSSGGPSTGWAGSGSWDGRWRTTTCS